MFFERRDGGSVAAQGARGIFWATDFAEFHFQGIVNQQSIGKCLPQLQDFLYGFVGLEDSDGAG